VNSRILISVLILFCGLTAFTPENSAQNKDTRAKIKAVFIYNFTKYIEWPESSKGKEFTIAILGENVGLYNELNQMSKMKKVGNQSFSIKTFKSLEEVQDPNILYIPSDSTDDLAKAANKLMGKSTLIVTEKPGMAQKGSTINFIIEGNRQKFELNKANAEKHNLKIASSLEKLAVLVN
jgi:hypothetical protein